ncbi:MAG: DeoR family transcriptional regulator [Rhodobacterales bacterium CG2_30_65_12]|nr:MAG: DeoR family transcriptional regulator [Rhodobacterales bacterium CG2_30_65_12]
MKPNRTVTLRQTAILKHLKQNGRALVDDLADMFGTTPQTIRKDLNALASVNQIARFHGGAALVGGTEYIGFRVREQIARDQKEQIAGAVAGLIPNTSSLAINAGTTTVACARRLAHHIGLQVVTDSVFLANEIREFIGLEVIVPAGTVRKSDGAILGEAAVDFIRQFRVDTALIGTAAIAPDGAMLDYDLREAAVVRVIIENARNVILAADSMKFGRAAPVCIGHLDQVDTLVTDAGCPVALRQICAAKGVRLVTAK